MLSSRLPLDLSPNALSLAVAARRGAGLPLIDLTESNPTRVGFEYPSDLFEPLARPDAFRYDPEPFGLPSARAAVARDFQRRGHAVDPSMVTLTASTSEAYSQLFKLFCDPGDRVLVPRPSYPLFEHLTRLDAVHAAPYAVDYHGSWRVDLESLERAIAPRSRVLLVVSPNNPTGSFLHRDDLRSLVQICRRHGLALVGDEVFADYPLDPAPGAASVLDQAEVVTCALGGLSKSCALPQVKLGWIAWSGPEPEVSRALAAYEIIADSYLSVSTPVQVAAPRLIERGGVVRDQVRSRVARNLAALRATCRRWPSATVLQVEGGWSAVVQVPAVTAEEDLVVALVKEDGVLVHPGYFFDFTREAFLVVSLIVEPAGFDEGVARLLARASGGAR